MLFLAVTAKEDGDRRRSSEQILTFARGFRKARPIAAAGGYGRPPMAAGRWGSTIASSGLAGSQERRHRHKASSTRRTNTSRTAPRNVASLQPGARRRYGPGSRPSLPLPWPVLSARANTPPALPRSGCTTAKPPFRSTTATRQFRHWEYTHYYFAQAIYSLGDEGYEVVSR